MSRATQPGASVLALQNSHLRAATSSHCPRLVSIGVLGVLLAFTFVLSGCGGNPSSTADAPLTAQTSTTSLVQTPTASTAANYPIKVFFSKSPVSLNSDPSAVYPVDRFSPTIGVATFAIQLLIAGPTPSERSAGYFTELNTMLNGPSNCSVPLPVGGPDFTLTLDKKGTVAASGTATLQFCRSITSAGVGADARVQSQIMATLKQFTNIKKVVILSKDGHCFADESGRDLCLR